MSLVTATSLFLFFRGNWAQVFGLLRAMKEPDADRGITTFFFPGFEGSGPWSFLSLAKVARLETGR